VRRPLPLLLASFLITGSLFGALLPSTAAHAAEVYRAKRVVGNLQQVAAFVPAPDGTIFLAERITGKIRIFDPATKTKSLFARVTKVVGDAQSELGLDGITLDPAFDTNGFVYVYASRAVSGGARLQILRYTDVGGQGTSLKTIYTSATTAGPMHIGGKMVFGPDGKLYVPIGDRGDSTLAQDPSSERGKVLRMNRNGSIPKNNPTPASRVYSLGLRNSFGMTFDPETGNLWETENGPECNDEINLIVPGGNYGWGPTETCSTPPANPENTNLDGPSPIMPLVYYKVTQGLTGAAFCEGCGLDADAEGKLFWGSFNTGQLTMATLTPDRLTVASKKVVHTDSLRVLSVETGPDGTIYYSSGKTLYRLSA
jgi:glucose/arabinose dehydrogenase